MTYQDVNEGSDTGDGSPSRSPGRRHRPRVAMPNPRARRLTPRSRPAMSPRRRRRRPPMSLLKRRHRFAPWPTSSRRRPGLSSVRPRNRSGNRPNSAPSTRHKACVHWRASCRRCPRDDPRKPSASQDGSAAASNGCSSGPTVSIVAALMVSSKTSPALPDVAHWRSSERVSARASWWAASRRAPPLPRPTPRQPPAPGADGDDSGA